MFISTVASVVGIAGGLNSMFGGGQQSAHGAQQAVDPFAGHRGEMGDMYMEALKQGGTVDPTQMPGYSQWMSGVMNPAMESTQGKMAASGMSGSGAEKQALQTVGQNGYYNFMTSYMDRLARGSGADQSPSAGGQAYNATNQNDAANLQAGLGGVAQGLGGVAQGLGGLFGGGGGYSGGTYADRSNSMHEGTGSNAPGGF